jgi:hypothetical protein
MTMLQSQVYKDALLRHIILYGSYVDAVYQNGLKDYSLPGHDNCLNSQNAWYSRNSYIRYMTLNVMDYRTTWLYMHTTVFPYPGVHVNLDRTIYSDPVGSCHYHVNTGELIGDHSFDYSDGFIFQYPLPSKDNNRLSYLRGTGKDFVRSLEVITFL